MDLYSDYEKIARYLQTHPDSTTDSMDDGERRKFQRTSNEYTMQEDTTFRKPTVPASALRQQPDARLGKTNSQRRTSHLRENVRVPSGPREFPSPSRRTANASVSSINSSTHPHVNNPPRTYVPTASQPALSAHERNASGFNFGKSTSNGGKASPLTPSDRPDGTFDFLPSVNFDDFQNSLAGYDGGTSLLNQFPMVGSTRDIGKEVDDQIAHKEREAASQAIPQTDKVDGDGLGRSQSLRRRLSTATTAPKRTSMNPAAAVHASNLSQRTRRQTSNPHNVLPGPASSGHGPTPRAPRKSVGPGMITSLAENRKSSQPLLSGANDATSNKAGVTRVASLTKASRRTTLPPNVLQQADSQRASTGLTSSQARQPRQKPSNEQENDPNTPPVARPVSKGSNLRAHTPSSSGNRRQSVASGRISGLGARTISPTDARRLKRLSMMQAPPMPSGTPQEELPAMKFEPPRLTQPSPSMIPRKANNATPSSARASPDGRQTASGGVSLHSKPSLQSLVNSSASQSRLPTPKTRNLHSSSAQYDEEETVPPVPAIPKGYNSAREAELHLVADARKSSTSLGTPPESMILDSDNDGSHVLLPPTQHLQRPSIDSARRKQSGESVRSNLRHDVLNASERRHGETLESVRLSRQPTDATGRKNNSLQPLRLPPLNLGALSSSTSSKTSTRSRDDGDGKSGATYAQTPEPKRNTKTPSTPMTASKATFFRRQDDHPANVRSSSSTFALRDLLTLDGHTTRLYDESDAETLSTDMSLPNIRQRNAITPFASGSLPKGSSEYIRQLGRPSGELDDAYRYEKDLSLPLNLSKPQGPRHGRSATNASLKTATPSSLDSPVLDAAQPESKKESTSSGLRRRLSFGWRRSGSKAANHPEQKSSPHEEVPVPELDKAKVQKRYSEMPPPRLPASTTWSGDLPTLPLPSRPSLESTRRRSAAVPVNSFPNLATHNSEQNIPTLKNSLSKLDQTQSNVAGNRASSWGAFNANLRPVGNKPNVGPAKPTQTLSAIVKDSDDLAADEEMRRLSQKRRDVDTAARETEDLWRRATARTPMTPEQVLHDRTCNLNIFERGEITEYEKDGVFFTGSKTARKIIGNLSASPSLMDDKSGKAGNYGYDDERGDYNIVLGDHLAYRYEVVDVLGKGSFGQVVRCVDHRDGGVVAVKIIRNKKRFHQQALVEVGILGRLREWDPEHHHATLSITTSFYFRSHLCIVTPCLSINLYELIRAHNFVGFSLPLIRRFARQLLACLVLLQQKRIIHCDLKPENILLCEARKADVRVIDFGSSCKEEEKVYTYIQSRFYRSPEVILGSSYGLGIDMWSFGCILAELWTGYPIFPGENEQEQLACIMEIFGPPDRHLVERCTRKKLFFDSVGKPRVTVSSKGRRRRPSSKTLAQALKSEDEAFLDFIARCLRWDPDRRMKPHDAVNHPFITNQPFNQRGGIPSEARRVAKLRTTAVAPANGASLPSPVKRSAPNGHASTASVSSQAPAPTPSKERIRAPLETPQTVVRTAGGSYASTLAQQQHSPQKSTAASRRHSVAPSANFNPVAGAKRTSNGIVVSTGLPATNGIGGPRQTSASISTNNLAQLAAKESMSGASGARWRT